MTNEINQVSTTTPRELLPVWPDGQNDVYENSPPIISHNRQISRNRRFFKQKIDVLES